MPSENIKKEIFDTLNHLQETLRQVSEDNFKDVFGEDGGVQLCVSPVIGADAEEKDNCTHICIGRGGFAMSSIYSMLMGLPREARFYIFKRVMEDGLPGLSAMADALKGVKN